MTNRIVKGWMCSSGVEIVLDCSVREVTEYTINNTNMAVCGKAIQFDSGSAWSFFLFLDLVSTTTSLAAPQEIVVTPTRAPRVFVRRGFALGMAASIRLSSIAALVCAGCRSHSGSERSVGCCRDSAEGGRGRNLQRWENNEARESTMIMFFILGADKSQNWSCELSFSSKPGHHVPRAQTVLSIARGAKC